QVVVLDKTGTITKGEPEVQDIAPAGGITPDTVLKIAAAAEKLSEHPLGKAIIKKAAERGMDVADPLDFTAMPGGGIKAKIMVDGCEAEVFIGNERMLLNEGFDLSPVINSARLAASRGRTPVF